MLGHTTFQESQHDLLCGLGTIRKHPTNMVDTPNKVVHWGAQCSKALHLIHTRLSQNGGSGENK